MTVALSTADMIDALIAAARDRVAAAPEHFTAHYVENYTAVLRQRTEREVQGEYAWVFCASYDAPARIRFAVSGEHTFGYVLPHQPDTLHILASKPQKGATFGPFDGSCPLGDSRHATLADFEDYRVVSTGYAADSARYEFPTA